MATVAEIKAWLNDPASGKLVYHRNFHEYCQALMWQMANKFGTVVSTPGSAIEAYHIERSAGRINPGYGPAGSFQYFNIGKFGHVSLNGDSGGDIMGSGYLQIPWGYGVGVSNGEWYCQASGATNLGWSWKNGGNTVAFTPAPEPTPPAPSPTPASWYYYDPTGAQAAAIQLALKKRGRYSGAVDGIWGPNTRKGVQLTIKNVGYTGPIDGVIESNGCYYIQVYAQKYGSYTGPVDRKLGPNSWGGFLLGLQRP